jgi:hypothetical protein
MGPGISTKTFSILIFQKFGHPKIKTLGKFSQPTEVFKVSLNKVETVEETSEI